MLFPCAAIAQLGERQTEDLKVAGSIPTGGIFGLSRYWRYWGRMLLFGIK